MALISLNVDQKIKALKEKNFVTPEKTKQRIISAFEKDQSESDGVETDFIKISLVCPLSKKRIETPCRAPSCNHLQCFDAKSYYEMYAGRKLYENSRCWLCPICKCKAPFQFLQVDQFLEEILGSENLPEETTEVILHKDGTWRVDGVDESHNITCIDLTEESFVGEPQGEEGVLSPRRSRSIVRTPRTSLAPKTPRTPRDIQGGSSHTCSTNTATTSGNPVLGTRPLLSQLNPDFHWQPYRNDNPTRAVFSRHQERRERRHAYDWNNFHYNRPNYADSSRTVWVQIPRGPHMIRLSNFSPWTREAHVFYMIRDRIGYPEPFYFFSNVGQAVFRVSGRLQLTDRDIIARLNGVWFRGRRIVAQLSWAEYDTSELQLLYSNY